MSSKHQISFYPRSRMAHKVLAKSKAGGYLIAEVHPVHSYGCPSWRIGRKSGPCDCGAESLYSEWRKP